MENGYKESAHWQALNRIWKELPAAARDGVKDDFRLLTELVKGQKQDARPQPVRAARDFENQYLAGMSKAAKAYAIENLTERHADVYKKITDFIVSNKIKDMDTLWNQYTKENEASAREEMPLREILCICLERARVQNLVD